MEIQILEEEKKEEEEDGVEQAENQIDSDPEELDAFMATAQDESDETDDERKLR